MQRPGEHRAGRWTRPVPVALRFALAWLGVLLALPLGHGLAIGSTASATSPSQVSAAASPQGGARAASRVVAGRQAQHRATLPRANATAADVWRQPGVDLLQLASTPPAEPPVGTPGSCTVGASKPEPQTVAGRAFLTPRTRAPPPGGEPRTAGFRSHMPA